MDIREYDEKRNELVSFVDKALQLKCNLPERIKDSLNAIRNKVYENQFRIVLISEFECGKSTTFNAICGGAEISPRGRMLRTSGTVISAQNTLDPQKANTANVIWRSDRELLLCFVKHLLLQLKGLDNKRFSGCSNAEQLCDKLRLPRDIELLKQAIRNHIQTFGSNSIPTEEEEALRIALLICEFYDSTVLDQMKQMPHLRAVDVERIVRFPKDWIKFDPKKAGIPFIAEECIFLFIKEVKLYIPSESLRRSGSVLVDCPGLSASDYDTKVTFDILENADAIWILYKDKGMGQEDLKYTRQLLQLKNKHIFFTVNARETSVENVTAAIIPNHILNLKKAGCELKKEDFHVYNALLALLALQAEKVIDGTLDSHTEQAVRSQADSKQQDKSIDKIIKSMVKGRLLNSYGFSDDDLEDMNFDLYAKDKRGIKFIRELCGLDKIVEQLENSVIGQKAKSILIDNGSEKVIEVLKQVEADLLVLEQTASDDQSKVEAELATAQAELEKFETFCKSELNVLDNPQIDHSLALDYWKSVIVDSIDEVAEKAAERISKVNLNEIRQELNEQIVNEAFSEVVLPKASNWLEEIREGNNSAFNALMDDKIKAIIRNTQREWEILLDNQPILAGLPVPTPIVGTDVMATDFVDSVIAKTPGVSKDVWTGAATGTGVGLLIGSFVFPVIGTAVGGFVGGLIGAAIGDGVGTNKRENFIKEELIKELTKNIGLGNINKTDTERSCLAKQEKRIKTLRLGIISAFKSAFDDTRSAFEDRQAEALKMCKMAEEQRTALVAQHTEVRTKQIEPLRRNIEVYKRNLGKIG